MRLTDEQRLDWLRLIRSERIGPRTFRALVNQHGGAAAALDALPEIGRRSGRGSLKVCSRAEAEREIAGLSRLGARLAALGEDEYPRSLMAIDSAPPLIAIRGDVQVLHRPTVAIVGSRNASAAGAAFAERLAAGLGQAGYVVVSGLARGIDTRAHRASSRTGTVAVLAGGLAHVYPSENLPLLDAILADGGAVLSEMPLGWQPRGRDFPRRNRIVSGLCYGVVVVEAARRSGSLITARFALEQGREVFAVPGSPLDPRAEGTNELIRSGATLCGSVEHVTAALADLVADPDRPNAAPQSAREARDAGYGGDEPLWDELEIDGVTADPVRMPAGFEEPDRPAAPDVLDLLGPTPILIDDLIRLSGLPVRDVLRAITEAELSGQLLRHGNNAVSLNPGVGLRRVANG